MTWLAAAASIAVSPRALLAMIVAAYLVMAYHRATTEEDDEQ